MTILEKFPSSSSDAVYEVRLGDDGKVYCTCPGWKFSKTSDVQPVKTCKHREEYLAAHPDAEKVAA